MSLPALSAFPWPFSLSFVQISLQLRLEGALSVVAPISGLPRVSTQRPMRSMWLYHCETVNPKSHHKNHNIEIRVIGIIAIIDQSKL
jgi:hypothetical protein